MTHAYNRAAFTTGADSSNYLLSLYCSLVALELAIKDHLDPPWQTGHKIIDWLGSLGETSLATQLDAQLSALYCTHKDGTEVNVKANQYPDLRYIRHESDFPGKSTDNQIQAALDIIRDIKIQLNARGVLLQ
ncbi:MAG: hypothetical protein HEQ20_04555 [Aphanizomenon flos-aquae KM1D3_PB]|uniref:hypothetical protein n=1 Tax=Aphanizomenon flos-aquae TaxID=1176 RepID=UPI00068D2AE6|nr:hypothetical protein [Aphanizomenon flos-aquae]QSV70169.1 MAG: hypothetical protein HEQ20_04555 [Aphanizomenon flos-aquae KM1D3_PB]